MSTIINLTDKDAVDIILNEEKNPGSEDPRDVERAHKKRKYSPGCQRMLKDERSVRKYYRDLFEDIRNGRI